MQLPQTFTPLGAKRNLPEWTAADYEDRDTRVRAVDPSQYKAELERRAKAIANDFALTLAESGIRVRHVMAVSFEPPPHNKEAFVRYRLKIDEAIECELWFKARTRGRYRWDKELRNRIVLRWGTPGYRSYDDRKHDGPTDFLANEPTRGFKVDKLVAEARAWIAERKTETAKEVLREREYEARKKAKRVTHKRQREAAKTLELALHAAGYGRHPSVRPVGIETSDLYDSSLDSIAFYRLAEDEVDLILNAVLEALVYKRLPWKRPSIKCGHCGKRKVGPWRTSSRGHMVCGDCRELLAALGACHCDHITCQELVLGPPSEPQPSEPQPSEPHVVSDPATAEEIAASDNKVIRDAAAAAAPDDDPFGWL